MDGSSSVSVAGASDATRGGGGASGRQGQRGRGRGRSGGRGGGNLSSGGTRGRHRGGGQRRQNGDASFVSSADEHADQELLLGPANRKGQISLNHLLNFSLPPRLPPPSFVPRRRRGVHHTPFNKERFMNANWRTQANIAVDWDDVEQVVMVAQEDPSCPICLSKPVAPRVARCGHVFCFGCVLRYLDTDPTENDPRRGSDQDASRTKRNWRKCPICWDSITRHALRGVLYIRGQGTEVANGDSKSASPVRMRLVQRDTLPTIEQDETLRIASMHGLLPWDAHPHALNFSRLTLASRDRYVLHLRSELAALETAMKEARDWQSPEEIPYLEAACAIIRDKAQAVNDQWTANMEYAFRHMQSIWQEDRLASSVGKLAVSDATSEKDEAGKSSAPASTSSTETGNASTSTTSPRSSWQDASSNGTAHPFETFIHEEAGSTALMEVPVLQTSSLEKQTSTTAPILSVTDGSAPHPGDYYFYQSDDGRYCFIHPLYQRALKQDRASPKCMPDIIDVTPENTEESTMTEELRKRFKFLKHLPLGCDFSFIDIDLRGLVSAQTLSEFGGDCVTRTT
ncbi:hypothetical protein THASP1DRAFT_31821 [Thamnocephalis sphaerospora]|uniref:RING-type domain-containing protein n=1 Tax=Thamnocephalis sphaerospora TaxID=78915 RepID=A0A4P9XLY6_9FUNG|nr:hypothetical protein THASP1DRAFT_31821 [Thamnocephalis sphaerospora]|eukprot:RKP06361.1 hypothetical protein THASP1DRAFT_31821 [Thamnocephalis sphaerospora]